MYILDLRYVPHPVKNKIRIIFVPFIIAIIDLISQVWSSKTTLEKGVGDFSIC